MVTVPVTVIVTVSGVQILVPVYICVLLVPVTLMMPIRMMNGRVGTRTRRRSGNRLPHARHAIIKTCKTQSRHCVSMRWDGTAPAPIPSDSTLCWRGRVL